MSFTWPFALFLLLVVPLVVAIYLVSMRRRRKQAVTYSSLALLRTALPRRSRWRRHLPVALLLASLVLLALASARPQITSEVPVGQTSVILAIDDSGSMCSTDVVPDRLTVAQNAARNFVNSEPKGVRMGLVVFSGFAELAVPPTTDRSSLVTAINNLSVAPGTAIGAAILQALNAIAEVDPAVQPVGDAVSIGAAAEPYSPTTGSSTGATSSGTVEKPGKNGYVPDVIVLLTDGANNRGIAPLDAVPYAVARGVRVYTIGFGTTHPAALMCTLQQQGGEQGGFGGYGGGGYGGYGSGGYTAGGYGGFGSPLVADLPTLQKVSARTGGVSYAAKNASQLSKVFANLPKQVATQKQRHEVSADFALIAALMILAAIGAAIRWSPYP